MPSSAAHTRPIRTYLIGAMAVTSLFVTACGGSGGDDAAAKATTTTAKPTTTTAKPTTTTEAPTTTTEAEPDDGQTIPGGVEMVGGKAVLLDGFIGVKVPDGWEVTGAKVPLLSETEGAETELDTSALDKVLTVNPVDDPKAGSFTLVHYTHSDKVPELSLFSDAVRDYLVADGGQVGEPKDSTIGGQEAKLHQITTPKGASGLMIPFKAGDEYFFIYSTVPDKAYSKDAAAMITSLSFVPEALHS